jgi:uncharacterized protein
MKKNILIFCLLLLGTLVCQSQLLWKVSGNGLKKSSYLFGTHQLISIQFLDSVPGLFKAFNSCDKIVGEMVINNIDATAKIQQAAIMPNYINMKDLLSDDEYVLLDNELNSVLKFGLKKVSIMNPSLILSLYKMELYKKLTGLSDDIQSDSYLQLCASEKGKKVIGLETVEQQISFLFENGSLERQADILVESVQHKDSLLNEIIYSGKLYKAGKIDELIKLTKGTGKTNDLTSEEYDKLVDNRNADWLTKLPGLFKESPSFVAVESLHLGGKNGIIKQLEKAGYKVKAVE